MVHRIDRVLTIPPLQNGEVALAATLCLLFQLTPSEGRALLRLIRYDHATTEELHSAIADGVPATGVKVVGVIVSRVRRKLARHDIVIVNIWGLGFRLADGARDKIRMALADHGADVVAATTPSIDQVDHAA